MQMKRVAVLCGSAVLVVLVFGAPVHSQFTLQQFNSLKKSVVRVDANQCSGGDRSATGFFWHQNTWVVTALHVINGCTAVSIYSEAFAQPRHASVIRVLRKDDLALLKLSSAIPGASVLYTATTSPPVSEDLEVLGYPLAIPKMESTEVRLRFGGTILRDIVPPAVSAELSALGSPDPSINVTDIQGNLLPGHSGAPILDVSGKIVAIADGGLENGAVGASWGLPAANLALLASSVDPTTGPVPPSSAHLFAAENDALNGPNVSCGGGNFKMIRRLSFGEISHATDDPLGLDQMINAVGPLVSSFRYDVYEDPPTGATFVVPANTIISSDASGMCTAPDASGTVVIRAQIISGNGDPTGQASSVQYEDHTLQTTQGWQIDPAWTYLSVVHRFDGFAVRRKSLVHYSFYRNAGWMMDATIFETLADRRGVFLGVSALNRRWTPEVIQTQQSCRFNPQASPYCGEALEDFREWAQAAIAVHLATFPIG